MRSWCRESWSENVILLQSLQSSCFPEHGVRLVNSKRNTNASSTFKFLFRNVSSFNLQFSPTEIGWKFPFFLRWAKQEILVMSPEKKSSHPKKQILKGSEFQTVNKQFIALRNFLSLKRSLFPTTPWRFLKRYSFLTTKGNVARFQQQTEALFVWYVIVSYSRTFRKLEKLFLGF